MDDLPLIIVVGSINIDIIMDFPELPIVNRSNVHGRSCQQVFGGKGANQAVAIGKLGGNVHLIGRLGDDTAADEYLIQLRTFNVNCNFIRKTKNTASGTFLSMQSHEQGRSYNVLVSGANKYVSKEDIDQSEIVVNKAVVMICQLEINQDVCIYAIEKCQGITILYAFPAIEHMKEVLYTLPTFFCLNASESEAYSGISVKDETDARNVVKLLLKKGCRSIIIMMGYCEIVYGSKEHPFPVYMKPMDIQIVDRTGETDVFVGALAYLLAYKSEDLTVEKVLQNACAAAAVCCQKGGGHRSFPGVEVFNNPCKVTVKTLKSPVKSNFFKNLLK